MRILLFIPVFALFVACKDDTGSSKTIAVADIYSVSSTDGVNYIQGNLIGDASLEYSEGETSIEVNVAGLDPNTSHAMHLHMGTLAVPGMHWNQGTSDNYCDVLSLGIAWKKKFAGDVGNIAVDKNGEGQYKLTTDLWTLRTGENTDIAKTVLFIHALPEDFATECGSNHHPGGHTNSKIAGGSFKIGS